MNWLNDIEKTAKEVLNILGEGYVESVYEEALAHELRLRKIPYERQKNFEIIYKGYNVGVGTADLIINPRWCNIGNKECVLEIKRAGKIQESYKKQAQVYMISLNVNDGAVLCFADDILLERISRPKKSFEYYVIKSVQKVKKSTAESLKESAKNVFDYFGSEFTFRDDLIDIFIEAISVELRLKRIDFSKASFDICYKHHKVSSIDFDFIFRNEESATIEFYDKAEKLDDLKDELKFNKKQAGLKQAYLVAIPKSDKGNIIVEAL